MEHMSRSDLFEWDDDKAATNEARHGIPFTLAARPCLDPRAVILPDPYPAEERFRIPGHVGNGLIIFVVTTDREERTRSIGARMATPAEADLYLTSS
jgi:uncharacterized DUF497 family protein